MTILCEFNIHNVPVVRWYTVYFFPPSHQYPYPTYPTPTFRPHVNTMPVHCHSYWYWQVLPYAQYFKQKTDTVWVVRYYISLFIEPVCIKELSRLGRGGGVVRQFTWKKKQFFRSPEKFRLFQCTKYTYHLPQIDPDHHHQPLSQTKLSLKPPTPGKHHFCTTCIKNYWDQWDAELHPTPSSPTPSQ